MIIENSLDDLLPDIEKKEVLAKKLLKSGLTTAEIIFAVKKNFGGSGIGTSKLSKLRKEIKTESQNGDQDSGRSKSDLDLIDKNLKLHKMCKSRDKMIKQFFELFMAFNTQLQSGQDIDSTIFKDEVGRHTDGELITHFMKILKIGGN